MSVLLDPNAFRKSVYGLGPVSKSTGTLAATTVALFTIAGGEVMVTAMWGKVTTAITVANSYKLQFNPTTGDTGDMCAATDIGTNDSAAGSLLTFALATTTAPAKLIAGSASGGGYAQPLNTVLSIGQIEHVSAGTDGVITWYVMWVPLTDGATLVAA
jgi:hypothetical protein